MVHAVSFHLKAKPFLVTFAPMVGLSHFALRKIIGEYVPEGQHALWPTEMLSSWKLPKEDLANTFETKRNDFEYLLSPQILGNEEEPIRDSVKKLEEWGASAIDINMGCPVTKALRHNYGVALMGDPEYAKRVVEMTVKHASVPVSVKLRAGLQNDIEFLIQFCKGLEEAGASWITLHPRVAALKRRGKADWSQIKRLKEELKIPVIGNGDIEVTQDVFDMVDQTGCDLVMAGRALAARPWMMWQVGERLGFKAPVGKMGSPPTSPSEEGAEYGKNLIKLMEILHFEGQLSFEQLRRKLGFYVRMTHMWLEYGHLLQSLVSKAQNIEMLEENLRSFFSKEQNMSQRSALKM